SPPARGACVSAEISRGCPRHRAAFRRGRPLGIDAPGGARLATPARTTEGKGMEKLLNRKEIAELAGVTPRTIDRWRQGFKGATLRTRQKGGRLAFTEEDLMAF